MAGDALRKRARRKAIQVTFPSGKVICYANVTNTVIGTLCEIGSDRFPEINLEIGHLPILAREIYPKYKDWMKAVCDGWYYNSQSNTDQKYLQLRAISESLGLGFIVEIGDGFDIQNDPYKVKKSRTKDNLLVKFPDGEYIASNNSVETYTQTIWKIGIDGIMRKGLQYGATPLISTYQMSKYQVQVGVNRWLTVPNNTKDRFKMLRVIALHMRINLEINII